MLNMSFKTNTEIVSTLTLWPSHFTLEHYRTIFTDPAWYSGYINSLIYVAINTVVSLAVALPAAYAFSRYRFIGDRSEEHTSELQSLMRISYAVFCLKKKKKQKKTIYNKTLTRHNQATQQE